MQQSPTTSIKQDSSPVTISYSSSETSLNKTNKLEKWRRIGNRVVKFFRLINIPILRSRFIDMVSHISIEQFESEGLNGYEANKVQQDLLFLDDIKRYREVFNTFSSFGFIWQDKEFRIPKLKANYIYDHYMSTPETIAKTNIPMGTIPFMYNRINSPRIFSQFIYLNLFNDAEKFIIEKLLMIYICKGLNCFCTLPEKQSISILDRSKGNRITNGSISSFEHLKKINKTDGSISDHSNSKLKDTRSTEPRYDELIIPNWTYSTDLGVVYNPIREKRVKINKRNVQKKTKDLEPNSNSMVKHSHSASNEVKLFDSTYSKSVIHTPSIIGLPSHINRQNDDKNSVRLISTNKSLFQNKEQDTFLPLNQQSSQNSNRFLSRQYFRCDTVFNKDMFDKQRYSQKVFICKVHSQPLSGSNQPLLKNPTSYRMAPKPQPTHFSDRIQRLCR